MTPSCRWSRIAVALSAVLFRLGVSVAGPGGDLFLMDPPAYLTGAVAGVGVVFLVLIAPRVGVRE
jgi:hypothetical protein